MYDIHHIVDAISLLIRKLLKNTLFYPIMGHTKTRKVFLLEWKSKTQNKKKIYVETKLNNKNKGYNLIFIV
jgi:hypothetical protein